MLSGCVISDIHQQEYADNESEIYLDNAGMPMFAKSVLAESMQMMMLGPWGNPHSQSLASQRSQAMIDKTRLDVLNWFGVKAEQFGVCFTLNSTHAVKLLSEVFSDKFPEFKYFYERNSHTSLIGVREHSGESQVFDLDVETPLEVSNAPTLVSWSGQSNFNGQKFPTNLPLRNSGDNCFRLLDASSLAGSNAVNLGDSNADFIAVSFYKIFGYPDMGALIYRKDRMAQIARSKRYFGGGTVDALNLDGFVKRKEDLTALLEDGTIPVHSIIQLQCAMNVHHRLFGSMNQVSWYLKLLTEHAVKKLTSLKYANGRPQVTLYRSELCDYGPILSFSLLSESGRVLGYYDFDKFVSARGIALRTGTLCNIGGVSKFLNQSNEQIVKNSKLGHKCGDSMDVIDGNATGVVRISFGMCNSFQHVDFLTECISDFLSDSLAIEASLAQEKVPCIIEQITVYPIKSCPGFDVPRHTAWNVTSTGLEFDRQFCLINLLTNTVMQLKSFPKMVKLIPILDREKMVLGFKNDSTIQVSLLDDNKHSTKRIESGGKAYECIMDKVVLDFLYNTLNTECCLAKLVPTELNPSLQNKSAFLFISAPSLEEVERTHGRGVLRSRFRANFLVKGKMLSPFIEDTWSRIEIPERRMDLTVTEKCGRCHMITIDDSGKRDFGLFKELSQTRKQQGKIYFGINVDMTESKAGTVVVGDEILGMP
ncbi:BA75_02917T0 [Komagataella pastoris]|uniref:BA75_02917T0 n=1 Tax=Komagataella pastoris TaxID=4922 RepID=A0A1B2JBS6_PICPA|nr:BA75_02917T0 [Komagataella pastoris]